MGSQIHYEIFRRQGAKGGWSLHEIRADREGAVALAQEMMASEQATGVKVVKETYNEDTGDYLSLKIFEEGHNQVKIAPAQEDAPNALPCFKPDDLYSYHARATVRRLLPDFLARNKITVTELIHRADLLEKLEATGTLYQHAIQKVAVAQAASTAVPVQQIVKGLNELATQAIHRVYRDQRKDLFPAIRAEGFADLARSLTGQGNAAYIFNGALALHLKDARGWDEKMFRLLSVMHSAPPDGEARALMLGSIDAIVAEGLSGSAALHELLGPSDTLGGALSMLVELFLGNSPPAAGGDHPGLAALAARFAAGELPEAHTAIAGRIVAEFKSQKRLAPDSLVDELKTLRRIANRVVLGVGKHLSHDDLIGAFTLRSKRLVTQEILSAHIEGAPADEKVERLLFVEENVIGTENKRQLAGFVLPVIQSAPFENFVQNPKTPLLQRLQRLAQLQTKVRRSNFIDAHRQEIAEKMDRLGMAAAERGKLFEGLEARGNMVERAQTLLKLSLGGFFTEGLMSARAREMILASLATPGFLAGYFATKPGQNTATAMDGLMADLGKAGITPETGLKNIAA